MAKRSVSVRIRGQEFRIRSDEDEAALQRIAGYLDRTMAQVEEKTGTVDSLSSALLTALNLAREVVELREGQQSDGGDPRRLRSLIELAETAFEAPASDA
jgi:cell division protein ZapA (FtsZ GTPase activity inhibitor)